MFRAAKKEAVAKRPLYTGSHCDLPLGLHDLFAGFALLDGTASTRRLRSTLLRRSHSTTSAFLCHLEMTSFFARAGPRRLERALPPGKFHILRGGGSCQEVAPAPALSHQSGGWSRRCCQVSPLAARRAGPPGVRCQKIGRRVTRRMATRPSAAVLVPWIVWGLALPNARASPAWRGTDQGTVSHSGPNARREQGLGRATSGACAC